MDVGGLHHPMPGFCTPVRALEVQHVFDNSLWQSLRDCPKKALAALAGQGPGSQAEYRKGRRISEW
jgi:hypothetical protein